MYCGQINHSDSMHYPMARYGLPAVRLFSGVLKDSPVPIYTWYIYVHFRLVGLMIALH